MKLICSIGSCLSANVACQIHKLFPDWYRISSVQHNRIDQLNSIYIEKRYKPLSLEDLGYEISEEYKHVNTLDNQIKGVGFGRSLPKKDDPLPLVDFIDCVEFGRIDLFIFDNFAELLFKIYRHKQLKTPMFINKHYLVSEPDNFEFENKFMNANDVRVNYTSIFKFIFSKNPMCKIVFIPFPVNLKADERLIERYNEQLLVLNELKSVFDNVYVLPERNINDSDLLKRDDLYHFNEQCYFTYARDVFKTII